MPKSVLVTGAAGFIGYHLSNRLIAEGFTVVGVDNINDYYDPALKNARLNNLYKSSEAFENNFKFIRADISDCIAVETVFKSEQPNVVVNLAAQAGVRYSIENPHAYIESNILGFNNILEGCRYHNVEHLIYASSSSVYGGNTHLPFSEHQSVNHPVSVYAATKKSNELMAHAYSHLYSLPTTGLRFFTVYGPWGRPDMALFLFTKSILAKKPIQVFNNGDMIRDFTYVEDIVESLLRLLNKPAQPSRSFDTSDPDPATSWAPYRIFNIGNSRPVSLMSYVNQLEKALGVAAELEFKPMQPGDVKSTESDTSALEEWLDYKPQTEVQEGIERFVSWYKEYYNV